MGEHRADPITWAQTCLDHAQTHIEAGEHMTARRWLVNADKALHAALIMDPDQVVVVKGTLTETL